MIVFTTERCGGACVVHLDGSFEVADDPRALVQHIVEGAGPAPLLIDLTGLDPVVDPKVSVLVNELAAAPTSATTVLVHGDLDTRRALRAASHGLPVVPSNDLALQGRFASALVAQGSHLQEASSQQR